jgi:hypothetical protein
MPFKQLQLSPKQLSFHLEFLQVLHLFELIKERLLLAFLI